MIAPGGVRLHAGAETPIERCAGQEWPPRRIGDGGIIRRPTRFDQGDADVVVFTQPGGKHTAGAARADDHVIKRFCSQHFQE